MYLSFILQKLFYALMEIVPPYKDTLYKTGNISSKYINKCKVINNTKIYLTVVKNLTYYYWPVVQQSIVIVQ